MCVCVHTFKHEYLRSQLADHNQLLSEASLGWGKGFGPDRIGTLISMATDSSQGYNGENLVTTLVPVILIGSLSFLQLTRTTINS